MNKEQLALLEGVSDIQELSTQDLFEVAGGYPGSGGTITYPYWVPPTTVYGQPVAGYWVYEPKNPYSTPRGY